MENMTKIQKAFQKADIEYIKQIVNGEEYPYEMMELNTGNGQKDIVGYHRLLDATGCLFRSEGNMVRFRIWGHGKNCTLFAFSKMANEDTMISSFSLETKP